MLKVSLVTPDKKILDGAQVEELFVPAFRGELNILPGHAPLVSTLTTGVLKYRLAGEQKVNPVVVSWGYLEIADNQVTILAETAEDALEIDLTRAKQAKDRAEKELLRADLGQSDFRKQQAKLDRAIARMSIAGTSANKDH